MLNQSMCGSWRLNAFSDQLQAEGLSEPDDGANDGQVAGVGAQVADEAGVDLEHVDWEGLQVRQHRIAGAEVVDRDLDSDFLELREGSASGLDVVHHGPLGDLEAYRAAVDAELVDGVGNTPDEAAGDQLNGRHIDAHYRVLSHPVGSPPAQFGAGASHHPSAQLCGEVGRFGYTDERIR